jgi:hypothetical protein
MKYHPLKGKITENEAATKANHQTQGKDPNLKKFTILL